MITSRSALLSGRVGISRLSRLGRFVNSAKASLSLSANSIFLFSLMAINDKLPNE